jgi:glutaredoxin 3
MGARVTLYTTPYCGFCVRAKALLDRKNVSYEEINVESRPDLRDWLVKTTRRRTVPQVFVNGEPLGGFMEIAALDKKGELDPLLARDPVPSDPQVLV